MKTAVKEMVTEVENLDNFDSIIIESGNCKGQHKSVQHFMTSNSSQTNWKNLSLEYMELKVMVKGVSIIVNQ